MKVKLAAIIKHQFRDYDYRVDIIEVGEDYDVADVRKKIERQLLGHFQVVAITERIDFNMQLSE
jgi:hypothetical protein